MIKKLILLPLFVLTFIFGLSSAVFAAPGDLDPSFGVGGKVIDDSSNSVAFGVIVQNDGKIVTTGFSYDNGYKIIVLRHNIDGSLDSDFGVSGKVIIDVNSISVAIGHDLIIQPDGKIVIVGSTVFNKVDSNETAYRQNSIVLIRLNSDGTFDSSFGNNGLVFSGSELLNMTAYSIVIQPDGKLAVAGYFSRTSILGTGSNPNRVGLTRYNSDGTLDTSFGDNGIVMEISYNYLGLPIRTYANDLAIQPDGKLIIAGSIEFYNIEMFLRRYNPDGSVDTTFGGNQLITQFTPGMVEIANSLVIQPDGKVVTGGIAGNNFALVRYNSNGTLDTTFGTSGRITTIFPSERSEIKELALRNDGKIVATGHQFFEDYSSYFTLAMYQPDGNLDLSFGIEGTLTTDVLNLNRNYSNALAIQNDNKIITVGETSGPGILSKIALVRYEGVNNQLPIANAGPDQTVNEAQAVLFDGSLSSDPDGIEDIVSYEWDFGDNIIGNGITTYHTYDDNGVFNVSLIVTDSAGETSTDWMSVTINNVAPTATLSLDPTTIIEGESSTLLLSNVFDVSTADTSVGFTYSYDCTNDGVFEVSNSLLTSYQCSYPLPGITTASARVMDKDGGYNNYTSAITVLTPAQGLENLIDTVTGMNLQNGIDNSLDAKLDTAIQSLTDLNQNNDQAAINSLTAFINAVEAQRGNKITITQADILIDYAQRVIDSLL